MTLKLDSRLGCENRGWVDGTSHSTTEISSDATSAATVLSKTASAVGKRGHGESESLSIERGWTFRSSNDPSSPTAILGAMPNSCWPPMMRSCSTGAGRPRDGPAAAAGKSAGPRDLALGAEPEHSPKIGDDCCSNGVPVFGFVDRKARQSWNRVTGHRVNWSVIMSGSGRVRSGLGSKLFTYRPGIVTQLLTEQQNDTAWLTHERIDD